MRLSILFVILINFALSGQDIPVKWGKISTDDLNSTSYELDPDAEAVVLCDYGNLTLIETDRGHLYRLNRTRRIKILKESGLERGNIFINFYHAEGYEKLRNVQAQVFLPDGKKLSIKKSDIFTEKKSEYVSSKNFSIPSLQVGSVFEYRYELTSQNLTSLTDWYFQEDIPIVHSQLDVTIPEYFEYLFIFNGYELTSAPMNLKASDYGSSLKVVSMKNPFILKDIPAITEERFITSMDDYRLGIRFQLNKIHRPDGFIEPVLESWPEVVKEIEEHRYIGKQYLNTRNCKKLIASAAPQLANVKDDKELIVAASTFLRSNLKFDGYRGFVASDVLDRLFEKGEVDSGEMNLMLMALLHDKGIPVYPLLVSTRDHGKMITKYPIIDQFNHLMIYAVVDGKETILDLGSPHRSIYIPRTSALNKVGFLVNGENSKWIEINAPQSNRILMAKATLNEEGILQGDIKGKYSHYEATSERYNYDEDTKGEYWQKRLSEFYPDASIDSFKVKNESDVLKDFWDEFSFTVPDAIQESGDLLYLSPILFSEYFENPFKQENRFYPIDINYPQKEQYIFYFTIPEGYVVESLPEAINIVLLDRSATYNYDIKVKDNQLNLVSVLQLKQLSYSPYEYKNIKTFFDQLVEKMKEPIVLKKM